MIPTDLAGRPRHLAPKQPTEIIANSPASTVPATSTIDVLELIPEEQVWLDGLKTANTRRAYQNDVAHFARVLGIASSEKLYAADHRAVTYWENNLREVERLEPSTIRRRLSALSSLFTHLVDHGVVKLNPVREIKRPELDRSEGKNTPVFTPGSSQDLGRTGRLDADGKTRSGDPFHWLSSWSAARRNCQSGRRFAPQEPRTGCPVGEAETQAKPAIRDHQSADRERGRCESGEPGTGPAGTADGVDHDG